MTTLFSFRWLAFVFALTLLPLARGAGELPKVELKRAWPNLDVFRPVWLGEAPDGSRRLFLVEQRGTILILPRDRNGAETNVFFDIADRKPFQGNEEGLLALAFHPQFKTNGLFYVYYSQQNPRRGVLSEFSMAKNNPDRADPATERILLDVPQPYANHNGAALLFGPDGHLYLSLGDGGAANDPHDFGQNLNTVLGKILRLDVNARPSGKPYGIPTDNPFVGQGGGVREEIWAYGLRNVWRMSFDRQTGELWAADVGQNKWEEVNVITRGGNYGWNFREGLHPFKEPPPANAAFIDPIIEYPHNAAFDTNTRHSPGLSITGGYVYRGKKLPALQGAYLYADFALGTIWALRYENGQVTQSAALYTTPKGGVPRSVASFGEDAEGELYVLLFEGVPRGRIYELQEVKPAN